MAKQTKPFLTIKQQIGKLRKDGIRIPNFKHAEMILANHSYYSFINGYRSWFLDKSAPTTRFLQNITFNELLALYDFDSELRRILFPTILHVEDKMKSHVIYEFGNAVNMGPTPLEDQYLYPPSFDQAAKELPKLLNDLKGVNANAINHKEEAFLHSQAEYGYIPLWVMATNMTFGQVSRFYMCQLPPIKQKIASRVGLVPQDYQTALKILSLLRNRCAHNGRVFCFAPRDRLSNSFLSSQATLQLKKEVSQKLSSVIICLKPMLSPKRYKEILKQIDSALIETSKKVNNDVMKRILRSMGFSRSFLKWAHMSFSIPAK